MASWIVAGSVPVQFHCGGVTSAWLTSFGAEPSRRDPKAIAVQQQRAWRVRAAQQR